jgi:FtsP/CotA-like multicopper oxidase with cupredoxin domain
MLTRRHFAIGCGAFASIAIFDAGFGFSDPVPARTHLPIPMLIDAAKQGKAVSLKVMSGRHAFIEGKPTGTYGYSAPVLGPVIRVGRGDEVQVTVEMRSTGSQQYIGTVSWRPATMTVDRSNLLNHARFGGPF